MSSKWDWKPVVKTLPPVQNYQQDVRAFLRGLPDGIGGMNSGEFTKYLQKVGWFEVPDRTLDAIAVFRAHLYRFMLAEPRACLAFLKGEFPEDEQDSHYLTNTVLHAAAFELFQSGGDLSWMSGLSAGFENGLAANRIHSGEPFEEVIASSRLSGELKASDYAGSLSFGDRDILLDEMLDGFALLQGNGVASYNNPASDLADFLENEKHEPKAVSAWIREVFAGEQLDSKNKKEGVTMVVDKWVRSNTELSLEDRAKILETIGKGGDDPYARIAAEDVVSVLEEGRDWRYEVRQGYATPLQVWNDLQAQLPELMASEKGKRGARLKLFRELVTQDPVASQELLASLSEADAREALFKYGVGVFYDEEPEKFLTYTETLPVPKTEDEKNQLARAWRNYSWNAFRYRGEDYVQWVKEMPLGSARDAAVKTMLKVAIERDPAEGQSLRLEFEREESQP